MGNPILKRNYEHPLATTFNGFATQDKVGGITERFGPDQVFAALDVEGFARDEDIPALSGERPQDLGTAGSGTSDDVSRADHRHQMPTAAQVGAAPSSHTHETSQVTGLDTALANYLTKNNPAFTGTVSGPLVKIGGGGGTSPSTATPFVALANSGFCTLLAQTGSGNDGANHGVISSNGSWYWGIRDDGASGSPVGCWAINDPSDVRVWGTPAGMWIRGNLDFTGALSQAGTSRITAGGEFRGTNLRLTELAASAGKLALINANGGYSASAITEETSYLSMSKPLRLATIAYAFDGRPELCVAPSGEVTKSERSLKWSDMGANVAVSGSAPTSILSATSPQRKVPANSFGLGRTLSVRHKCLLDMPDGGTPLFQFLLGPNGTFTAPYYTVLNPGRVLAAGLWSVSSEITVRCISPGVLIHMVDMTIASSTGVTVYRDLLCGNDSDLDATDTTVDNWIDITIQQMDGNVYGLNSMAEWLTL